MDETRCYTLTSGDGLRVGRHVLEIRRAAWASELVIFGPEVNSIIDHPLPGFTYRIDDAQLCIEKLGASSIQVVLRCPRHVRVVFIGRAARSS